MTNKKYLEQMDLYTLLCNIGQNLSPGCVLVALNGSVPSKTIVDLCAKHHNNQCKKCISEWLNKEKE